MSSIEYPRLFPVEYKRLHADAAGQSHIEVCQIEFSSRDFAPPAPPFGVSEPFAVTNCSLLQLPPGWNGDWHPSPTRQWFFFLAGAMQMETSDGSTVDAQPGTVVLLEDTTGIGHRSGVVSAGAAMIAAVKLAGQPPIDDGAA